MMIPLISALLLAFGLLLVMKINPKQAGEDIMNFLEPRPSLKKQVDMVEKEKNKEYLADKLKKLKAMMKQMGKESQFSIVCISSIGMMVVGVVISILLKNIFIAPAIIIGFALVPFGFIYKQINLYNKHMDEELETALQLITTTYCRNNNTIEAINSNISFLKPPISSVLQGFLVDCKLNPNVKSNLKKMQDKVDNRIFHSWVECLIECQDDHSLSVKLHRITSKLTDERILNNELKTMIYKTRKEFYIIVGLTILNIPAVYILNKDWFNILVDTLIGKVYLGLTAIVVLFTTLKMLKITKPIKYKL